MQAPPVHAATSPWPKAYTDAVTYLHALRRFLSHPVSQILASIHTLDTLTHNHWERLPQEWRQSIDAYPPTQESMFQLWKCSCPSPSTFISYATCSCMLNWDESVRNWLIDAHSLMLNRYPTGTTSMPSATTTTDSNNSKKVHEVENLLPVIKSAASASNVTHIIDIGAGKGYISHLLSLRCNYNVIGVDSKLTNCVAAIERFKNMQKRFQASETKKTTHQDEAGAIQNVDYPSAEPKGAFQAVCMFVSEEVSVDSIIHAALFLSQRNTASTTSSSTRPLPRAAEELPKSGNKERLKEVRKHRKQLYQQNTILKYQQDINAFNEFGSNRNLSPSATSLDLAEITTNSAWSNYQYLLCGLHACGDLSAQLCRMFVMSEQLQCLAVVGCCYHALTENETNGNQLEDLNELSWLTETDAKDRHIKHASGCQVKASTNIPGFPLSQELQKTSYSLGTKARKRTWAPVETQEDCASESIRYIFHRYRAVLQLLFQQEYNENWEDRQSITGSLPNGVFTDHTFGEEGKSYLCGKENKPPTFSQYALYTLGQINYECKRTDIELEEFYQNSISKVGELHLDTLFSLQLIITTLNEAIILVDRYVYLQENNCNPQLFPIFSPSISPRNMILVANKSNITN